MGHLVFRYRERRVLRAWSLFCDVDHAGARPGRRSKHGHAGDQPPFISRRGAPLTASVRGAAIVSVAVPVSPGFVTIPIAGGLRFDTSSVFGTRYSLSVSAQGAVNIYGVGSSPLTPPVAGAASVVGGYVSTDSGSSWLLRASYFGIWARVIKVTCSVTPTQTSSLTRSQTLSQSGTRSVSTLAEHQP